MSDTVFLITGGGSGAKLAESFVHLCAAGLGPRTAHLLLVDADTDNGNLRRTEETVLAYQAMARWEWSAASSVRQGLLGKRDIGTRLFATDLTLYRLTQPISTVKEGGIATAVRGEGVDDVLDLFYDESEQTAKCEDGFKARPNLGCLLIANHLGEHLGQGEAGAFVKALAAAGSTSRPAPVVVAASVFGGTGASLLPVARRAFEDAIKAAKGSSFDEKAFRWSAVKLLPYYQPERRKGGTVDPVRFPLDAANALQFYSRAYDQEGASKYDRTYIVGSDRPDRNAPPNREGLSGQMNPPYFEELAGALAVRDAAGRGAEPSGKSIGVVLTSKKGAAVRWEDLPGGAEARERFAYLLHLAAFYLRTGTGGQLTYGLRQLLDDLAQNHPQDLIQYRWYQRLLDPWAATFPAYAGAKKTERPGVLLDRDRLGDASILAMTETATEFFGRLMLWARTALDGPGLSLLDYAPNRDYGTIYSEMERLKASDVDNVLDGAGRQTAVEPADDTALVRLFRAATVAMLRQRDRGDEGAFELYGRQSGLVELGLSMGEVSSALHAEHIEAVEDAYSL